MPAFEVAWSHRWPAIGDFRQLSPAGPFRGQLAHLKSDRLLGITTGPDGNLWFTEFGAGKIGRITPSGSITEFPIPTAGSGIVPTYDVGDIVGTASQ